MSTLTLLPANQPSLRLTRRGRVVVFLAALALVLVAAVFIGAASVANDSGEAGVPTPTRVVMVDEGDTLWAIASEIADEGEVRAMIDTIKQLNALDSASLQVGQEIHVPA